MAASSNFCANLYIVTVGSVSLTSIRRPQHYIVSHGHLNTVVCSRVRRKQICIKVFNKLTYVSVLCVCWSCIFWQLPRNISGIKNEYKITKGQFD